jgi:hypothetical protein
MKTESHSIFMKVQHLTPEDARDLATELQARRRHGEAGDDLVTYISNRYRVKKNEARVAYESYCRGWQHGISSVVSENQPLAGPSDEPLYRAAFELSTRAALEELVQPSRPARRPQAVPRTPVISYANFVGSGFSYDVRCAGCNQALSMCLSELERDQSPYCPQCGSLLDRESILRASRDKKDEWRHHAVPLVLFTSFLASAWALYQLPASVWASALEVVLLTLAWTLLSLVLGALFRWRGGSFAVGFLASLVCGPLAGAFFFVAGPTHEW